MQRISTFYTDGDDPAELGDPAELEHMPEVESDDIVTY